MSYTMDIRVLRCLAHRAGPLSSYLGLVAAPQARYSEYTNGTTTQSTTSTVLRVRVRGLQRLIDRGSRLGEAHSRQVYRYTQIYTLRTMRVRVVVVEGRAFALAGRATVGTRRRQSERARLRTIRERAPRAVGWP